MRHSLLLACVLAGCSGSAPAGGDDMQEPDGGNTQRTCPLPMSIADTAR
jgi:hypothetical protein